MKRCCRRILPGGCWSETDGLNCSWANSVILAVGAMREYNFSGFKQSRELVVGGVGPHPLQLFWLFQLTNVFAPSDPTNRSAKVQFKNPDCKLKNSENE